MRIKTLDNASFKDTVAALEGLCREKTSPDLVVGIANGGVEVARMMFADLPHAAVLCRRAGTSGKEKSPLIRFLLRHLPLSLLDLARIAEAKLPKTTGATRRCVHISDDDKGLIARAKCILIVDDAVDSGATLQAVYEAIRGVNPGASLASAAITVTTSRPVARPDFHIFDDGTLIRFPWSLDSKTDR